ncbi:MAG: GNAT family N-acetyltransferase [Chloroflexi bacterium]|nr:GNAT family N-acetyltransferase [Chloroflexota bacterium]
MWEDVPFARPTPHWPYEQYRKLMVESGKTLWDCSILALDGATIAGFTLNGERSADGYTFMTGVARTHRKRGIAFGLKVEALRRAKELGRRAMLTTNDEPNKSMRGINARLSYQMLPAHIELEKRLSAAS